jgi:hypothetical protein
MAWRVKWKQATLQCDKLEVTGNVRFFSGVGAPTNGTTGAGVAGPGSLYVDRTATSAKVYINTNTLASPTWVSVGSQV